ncbi:MAG: ATP-binding cassette domain-containing protein [Lachnospiraceae bacterium]
MERYPSQLSGGELQRLALARVMLMHPNIIILDEPTSMLDVIFQAQIITILKSIIKQNNIGYLFISHDLELCRSFCDSLYLLQDETLCVH